MTAQEMPKNLEHHPLYANIGANAQYNFFQIVKLYLIDFFNWWYIQMPIYIWAYSRRIVEVVEDRFSIIILIRTFDSPWKKDYSFVGFFMGIILRLLYLPIALSVLLTVTIASILTLILWILLPIFIVVMILITLIS